MSSPADQPGTVLLFGRTFSYHHRQSFENTYHEIFEKGIYSFHPSNTKPRIIDCGANMGLSLLFFCRTFPYAIIDAFEPDISVLGVLEKNLKTYEMHQVSLHKKAVWTEVCTLQFYTNRGMGGRLSHDYGGDAVPEEVQTIRLYDFIGDKPVDFLKIDIEGAEVDVLTDIEDKLPLIEHLFVEYHSPVSGEQKLEVILSLVKRNGFRYHLSESFSQKQPFSDPVIVDEMFDMCINIFAHRNKN